MKIRLKDNKITLYDIERDYRQYLFQYDFRVNLKPNRRLYIFHTINFKAFKKKMEKEEIQEQQEKFTTKVTKSLLYCLLIT